RPELQRIGDDRTWRSALIELCQLFNRDATLLTAMFEDRVKKVNQGLEPWQFAHGERVAEHASKYQRLRDHDGVGLRRSRPREAAPTNRDGAGVRLDRDGCALIERTIGGAEAH